MILGYLKVVVLAIVMYKLAHARLQTMIGEDRTVEVHGLNHKQNESKCNKMPQNSGQWGRE